MLFHDEVRSFEEVDTGATFTFSDVEKDLAQQLIAQLSCDEFEQEKYQDSFRHRVLQVANEKAQGMELRIAPEAPKAPIIDLFEALKQSLSAEVERPRPPIKATPEPVEPKKRAKK